MIKQVIFAATLVASGLAQAEIQEISRPTGREQLIDITDCSRPTLSVSRGIYRSTYKKIMCVEYQTYDADVTGVLWKNETRVSAIKSTDYRIETKDEDSTNVNIGRSSDSGSEVGDPVLDGENVRLRMTSALTECRNSANTFRNLIVPISQTPCVPHR